MTGCIVGWAHTPFGRLDTETVESLIVRVATDALADAGIGPADVDEIVLGHFNAGFSAQDFTASLVLQASDELRFKRATRVENACATGSAAVHQGLRALEAKAARIVLVVGVEQMTATPGPEIGKNLLKASYVKDEANTEGGFAGVFGKIANAYFQKYGDQSATRTRNCARISASSSAGVRARRIHSSRDRSSAPTARSSRTAPPPWCSPMSRPRCK